MVLLNFWWARKQIRHVQAKRFIPEPAFAQTPFPVFVQVDNPGRKGVQGLTLRGGRSAKATAFVSQLAGGGSLTLAIHLTVARRGRFLLGPLQVGTGHPLGLVHLVKEMAAVEEITVYPRLGALRLRLLRRFLSRHSSSLGQARSFPRRHPGAQTEFHGLRAFQSGDNPRWIHWRTTARRGELMVREFEDMPEDHLVLIVDPWVLAEKAVGDDPRLEKLVSFAATICWEWCRQKGEHMALAILDEPPHILTGITGIDFALEMLERLALIQGSPADHTPALLNALLDADLPPGPILVLTTNAGDLAEAVVQTLHRPVAQLNLTLGEEREFFGTDKVQG